MPPMLETLNMFQMFDEDSDADDEDEIKLDIDASKVVPTISTNKHKLNKRQIMRRRTLLAATNDKNRQYPAAEASVSSQDPRRTGKNNRQDMTPGAPVSLEAAVEA